MRSRFPVTRDYLWINHLYTSYFNFSSDYNFNENQVIVIYLKALKLGPGAGYKFELRPEI